MPITETLMRRAVPALLLSFVLMVGLAGFSPVRAQGGEADASASVRFVHASPDASAIDVLVDGETVALGLEFGAATEFAPFSDGEHSIQIVPAGQNADSALIDQTVDFDGDDAYSVAVSNLLNSLELKVIESDLDDLPANEARIRAVNLSPDDITIDIAQVGGDEWFDDVEFGEATEHRNVEAGSYDLDVRVHDAETNLVSGMQLDVTAGTEITLFVIGTQSTDSVAVLPLTTTVGAPCVTELGLSGATDDACVRITHAAIDAPAVDVYLEESLIIENLEPGATSEFLAVPGDDDRTFVLVPTGGSLSDQIVETGVDLDDGDATDIVIGGSAVDLKVINSEIDLSPIAPDQSRVRAVNLSSDAGAIDILVTDGDTLFGDVEFEEFADSILMNAGTYDIQVQKEGEDDVLFRSDALTIEPGMVYNLVATGSVDAGSFTLLVVSTPAPTRTGEGSGTAVASPQASPLQETTSTPAAEEIDATPTS
ncbi:MAG: DUF4397 domain-containing protein [Thermomicrobiales bacterium]|nr:DUF4397 domain-containing protein [Thermomicrobiales bacterium]